jgi:oxygen-independent coproporphyrinogen-3 oxidase
MSAIDDVSLELIKRYDRPGPRYTSYPTAPVWKDDFGPAEYRVQLDRCSERAGEPLSLYVHVPFCESLCLFCGCNVVITRERERAVQYLDLLEHELDLIGARLEARPLAQFHFGGGTPTYLTAEQLERAVQMVEQRFTIDPAAERAIEIDPRVTTSEQLAVLAHHGFNRVSLGVQDFDPRVQSTIHRVQSFEQTESIVSSARSLGFASVNVDLIYGLPHQSEAGFTRTLEQTLSLRPDRVAVYGYAHVPWLKRQQASFADALPGAEDKARLYLAAHRQFTQAGYVAIGMDHFARRDDELALALENGTLHRNFMGYTTRRAPDMVGAGVSAIGQVAGAFAQNRRDLTEYMHAIARGELATARGYRLSEEDHLRAAVILGLMCQLEVRYADIEERFSIDFPAHFARELEALRPGADDGLAELAPDAIRVTPLGRLFVRNLCMVFDEHLAELPKDRVIFSRTV